MSDYYSISLEDFINSDENTVLIPPPPSPIDDYEKDWFDEFYDKLGVKKLKEDEVVNSVQSDIYKDNMSHYIPRSYSQKLYSMPQKDSEAKRIWISAKIPTHATQGMIEMKLSEWVMTYAELTHTWDKTIIKWKTKSGYYCSSEWKTFVRWLICAGAS